MDYIQIPISKDSLGRLKKLAEQNERSIEDLLTDWVEHAIEEPPIESLSDTEVLKLADMMMDEDQDEEMSELLAQQREDEITDEGRIRLEELMNIYRRGMVRKATALRVAVERGLRPRLDA